jgi:hypothetical protein
MSKESVKEIVKKLEQGIVDLFGSGRYQDYLRTMAQFHNYSANNIFLIFSQFPGAQAVAGYRTWQQKFHRQVKKGEKAIKILAPIPIKAKKNDEDEEDKIAYVRYRTVSVFDISQTEGEELELLAPVSLTDSVESFEKLRSALESISTYPIRYEEVPGQANGYFSKTSGVIAIQTGMSESQTVKTLIHEIAHSILHAGESEKSRETKEVEAESVAYTVCTSLGIDTSDYSFPYIAGWSSGKTMPELRDSLQTIQKTASALISKLENSHKLQCDADQAYIA